MCEHRRFPLNIQDDSVLERMIMKIIMVIKVKCKEIAKSSQKEKQKQKPTKSDSNVWVNVQTSRPLALHGKSKKFLETVHRKECLKAGTHGLCLVSLRLQVLSPHRGKEVACPTHQFRVCPGWASVSRASEKVLDPKKVRHP